MLGHTWDAKQVVRKPRVVATRVLSWDGLVGKILTGNQGFFPGNIGVWTEHVPSWNLKFCTLIARFSSFDSVSIVTNLHWISMINCQLCKSSGLNSKTQGHRVILIPHPGRTDIWEATGTPGYRSFGDDFETFSGSVLLQQMPLEGFLELGSLWSPWLVIVIVWINCLTPIDLPTLIHKTAPTLAGFLVHRVCSIHPETGPIIICVFVFVLTNPCHLPFPGSLDAGKIGCLFCWWGTKGTIKKETPMANGCLLNHGAGARVAQLELKGERLHFRLLEGQGPQTGWASLKLKAGSDRGSKVWSFWGLDAGCAERWHGMIERLKSRTRQIQWNWSTKSFWGSNSWMDHMALWLMAMALILRIWQPQEKLLLKPCSDELPKDSGDEMGQSKHQIDENQEINNQSYLLVDFGSN